MLNHKWNAIALIVLLIVTVASPTAAQETSPEAFELVEFSDTTIVLEDEVTGERYAGARAYSKLQEPDLATAFEGRLVKRQNMRKVGAVLLGLGLVSIAYGVAKPYRTASSTSISFSDTYPILYPEVSTRTKRVRNPWSMPAKLGGGLLAVVGAAGISASFTFSANPVDEQTMRVHLGAR